MSALANTETPQQREWFRRLRSYQEPRGILRFIDEQFKAELDPWQEDTALAFESPDPKMRRIALQACVGPGKTAIEAMCGWWFFGTQCDRGEHPKGAAISITDANLHDNLWPEFAKWQSRSTYLSKLFTWTSSRISANHFPETWFLSARSWPKTANPEEQGKTLSGLHSKYVLILIDESGGIPPTVLRAGDQALVRAKFAKMLQAGNPIDLQGMLYAAANTLRHMWHVIVVTGDPDDPKAWVHSKRHQAAYEGEETPLAWAKAQIEAYGRDNPWVKSYVLGQFPDSSINTMISHEEVLAAMKRSHRPEAYQWAQKRIGADVARFGDDRFVTFPRQGIQAFRPKVFRNVRTTAFAGTLARQQDTWGKGDPELPLILVDDTGHWGHGVIDSLKDSGRRAIPVIFSDRAISKRYKNRRAEMWIQATDAIKAGAALPFIPELIPELTTPTFTFVNGVYQIEEKDQVKKRLGRSPDIADAFCLTYAIPDRPMNARAHHGADNRGRKAATQDDMEA
jgi:phage terminase large subunit